MLHPLEHVRDHQNPLTDAPALASRQAPQLGRPRFAAKEVCRHRPPQTWYAALLTLPHLEITGSRYYVSSGVFVTLHTSEEIFGRSTLTDALVVASAAGDVPTIVERLQEIFRLEPGVFITE